MNTGMKIGQIWSGPEGRGWRVDRVQNNSFILEPVRRLHPQEHWTITFEGDTVESLKGWKLIENVEA